MLTKPRINRSGFSCFDLWVLHNAGVKWPHNTMPDKTTANAATPPEPNKAASCGPLERLVMLALAFEFVF